jgi:hypothetical protein
MRSEASLKTEIPEEKKKTNSGILHGRISNATM